MSRPVASGAFLLAVVLAASPVAAQASHAPADSTFREFLPIWEQAVIGMLNGDTTAFLGNASRGDDVTLMMPSGGVVTGWTEVSRRYRAAAARMKPSSGATARFEYLAVEVEGDLAYIVLLECSDYMFRADTAMQKGTTRGTEAFRREGGQWKMMHRHMDHLLGQLETPEPGGKHC